MKGSSRLTGVPLPDVGIFKTARAQRLDNHAEKRIHLSPSYKVPGTAQFKEILIHAYLGVLYIALILGGADTISLFLFLQIKGGDRFREVK